MGTRALYTFVDERDAVHVYKHWDGYPECAVDWIAAALPHAWPLPRFEASDFAAAFVAGNKLSQTEKAARYRATADALDARGEAEAARVHRDLATRAESPENAAQRGGDVRIFPNQGDWRDAAPDDIQWRYEITARDGALRIRALRVDAPPTTGERCDNEQFDGTLEEMRARYAPAPALAAAAGEKKGRGAWI